MNKDNYKKHIIIPTLSHISPEIPFSDAAVNLILLTAICESNLTYIAQFSGGPARGFLQMEPFTESSLWTHQLKKRPALKEKILDLTLKKASREMNLVGSMFYQVAMARVKYWPDPKKLPKINDIDGMVNYYIRIYNAGGKADFSTVKKIYINRVLGE